MVALALAGPWAKVDRAAEDLRALELGCQVFLKAKPYYITAAFEPDAGHHVVRLRVRETVPLALSVTVGGLIHHLRSALDQAVWLIACRSYPVAVLWQDNVAPKIAFPFTSDPKKFAGRKVMSYIASDAQQVLEGMQPYHGTARSDALNALNGLSNVDKHRVVHAGFGAISLDGVSFRPRALLAEQLETFRWELVWERDRIAEDRAPIANGYFGGAPTGMQPNYAHAARLEVKGEPSARIFFGAAGGGRGYGIEGFRDLIGHVSDALAEIQALPEKPPA